MAELLGMELGIMEAEFPMELGMELGIMEAEFPMDLVTPTVLQWKANAWL
jgi:hypothetical protein